MPNPASLGCLSEEVLLESTSPEELAHGQHHLDAACRDCDNWSRASFRKGSIEPFVESLAMFTSRHASRGSRSQEVILENRLRRC
eukprot:772195-Amphidinium_carterae.1